ncbi:hypothetical protein ABHA60_17700, partial [Blautia wexlerae]|uniref:hypothetical protein n=1 Tax=Blautia wexlerae TaxID=418240 RepID=UPI00325C0EB4
LILNLSRSRRCLKSLSRRNAALYNLHDSIILSNSLHFFQTAAGPLRSRPTSSWEKSAPEIICF